MVNVVIWYLAILCGAALNMEKSEKYFSAFPLSLLWKLGWVMAKKKKKKKKNHQPGKGQSSLSALETLISFQEYLFRICLN